MPFDYPEEEQDDFEAPAQQTQKIAGLFPAWRMLPGSDLSSARFPNDPANGLNDAQFQRRYEGPPIPISKPGIGQRIVAMGQWREPFAIQEGQKQDEQKDIGQRIVQMGRQPMDSSAVPRLSLMSGASSSQLVSDNLQQGKDLFSRFVPPNSEPSANLQPNVRQLSNSFSGPNGGFRSMSQTVGLRQRSGAVTGTQRPSSVSPLATDGLKGSGQQPQQAPLDWQSPILGLTKEISQYLKWRDANFRLSPDGRWEAPSARLYTNEELRKLYADQKQQARWAEQARERLRQATAQSQGRTVTITYPGGEKERRKGNHPQRDNNPGNIESIGDFARNHGSIGDDKGIAVFPSADVGWAALDANLRTGKYQNMTLDQAVYAWAPPKDAKGRVINDTAKYQAQMRAALGVKGGTKISSLTPEQIETLKQAMARKEGFYEKRPGKKVDIVIEVPKRPSVIPRR